MMQKKLDPQHPVRCIITGPSDCAKSVFLTILFWNNINEYDKEYIYSPNLHQDLYKNIFECFTNFIPIHIIPNIFNEEDIDLVKEKIFNNRDFEKSNTEIETYESMEELKFHQESEDGGIIILYDLKEKEINDPRI